MRVNISSLTGILIAVLLVGCDDDDGKKKPSPSSSSLASVVASSLAASVASSEVASSSSAPSSVAASSAISSTGEVPVSSSAASSSVALSSNSPSSTPASSSMASSSAPADVALSGTAAVGAAIVNGTVTAKCANGSGFTQAVTTNNQGAYSGTLPASAFPCALQISGGNPAVTLHSYALASGTVNITPLTDLLIASATTQAPSTWFQSSSWQILEAQLQTAQNNLKTVLSNASYVLPQGSFDPLTISFQIGDVWDQLLDQLQAAIAASSTLSSYADLLNLVKDGNLNAIPPKTSGGSNGSGNAASCFNPDIMKQGTRVIVNYKTTDGETGAVLNSSSNTEVKGSATFNGKSATESVSQTQSTGDVPSTTTTKSYFKVDASAKRFIYYGSIVDITAPVAASSTLTINPERVERFDLSAGESYPQNYSIVSTTQVMGFPISVTSEYESQVTFKGMESVTVPAGTFNTCRFETTGKVTALGTTTPSALTINWLTVDSGVSVRTESAGDITVLVSGTIDGNPIQ
jgi:hypothetical protein